MGSAKGTTILGFSTAKFEIQGEPPILAKNSFAFAKTAWFCLTFLESDGGSWYSGLPPRYASVYCACTGDHVGLLIKSGSIQKEGTMTQTTIRNF